MTSGEKQKIQLDAKQSLQIFLRIHPKLWVIKIGKRYQFFSFESNSMAEVYKTNLNNYLCLWLKAKPASDIEVDKGILFSYDNDFQIMVDRLSREVLGLEKTMEVEYLYIG